MNKLLPIAILLSGLYLCACNNQPAGSTATAAAPNLDSLRAEGRLIVKTSFETLSKNLMQAMETGGIIYALPFCQTNAYPLTDSLSASAGVRIRRVATQYRNPANAPDEQEQAIFAAFASRKATGQDLQMADTILMLAPGRVLFAKPILLQPQCLACHGKVRETVTAETYQEILKRYPEDRAVGFASGDLRGMWAVYFE